MQTFVIRVWVPAGAEGMAAEGFDPGLRGMVEHVGSGRSATFRGAHQLVCLVQSALGTGVACEEGSAAGAGTVTVKPGEAHNAAERRGGHGGRWADVGESQWLAGANDVGESQ